MITYYIQKGKDSTGLNYDEEILLNVNPPIYFFRSVNELFRIDLNSNKYSFAVELVFSNSFIDLYKILSLQFKTKKNIYTILTGLNDAMQQEVNNLPSSKPKEEFETTEQYNKRIAEGEPQKQQIEKKYQDMISELKTIAEDDINEKIKTSIQQISLKIDQIGTYDADKQEYPITINGTTKNIKVPIAEAKSLKDNFQNIKVIAEKKLNNDTETWTIFDIKIIHPVTNSIYFFETEQN